MSGSQDQKERKIARVLPGYCLFRPERLLVLVSDLFEGSNLSANENGVEMK